MLDVPLRGDDVVPNASKSAGLNAVISGRFGPKACDALRAHGIEAWVAPPGITAEEALTRFRNGDLERMESQADRPSSWSPAELLVVAPQTTAAGSGEKGDRMPFPNSSRKDCR